MSKQANPKQFDTHWSPRYFFNIRGWNVKQDSRTPRKLETVAYEIGFLVAKPSPQTKCEKGLKGPNALSYSPTGALHPFEADASKFYYSGGNMFPMLKPKRSPVKELRKFPFMHALYGGIITTFRWVFQGENGKFRTPDIEF